MPNKPLSDADLVRKLSTHPQLRSRIESLLAIVEDDEGTLKLADDAESRLIGEMRSMGQESMQAWAEMRMASRAEALGAQAKVRREGKKNSAGTAPLVISK